jgi:hypothetical protein
LQGGIQLIAGQSLVLGRNFTHEVRSLVPLSLLNAADMFIGRAFSFQLVDVYLFLLTQSSDSPNGLFFARIAPVRTNEYGMVCKLTIERFTSALDPYDL